MRMFLLKLQLLSVIAPKKLALEVGSRNVVLFFWMWSFSKYGSFLSIPHRLSDRPKNYPSMSSSFDLIYKAKSRHAKSEVKQVLRLKWNGSNPKSRRISFTLLFGRFWGGWWDDFVNHFFSCFFIKKKLKKLSKNYLSNMCHVSLFFI